MLGINMETGVLSEQKLEETKLSISKYCKEFYDLLKKIEKDFEREEEKYKETYGNFTKTEEYSRIYNLLNSDDKNKLNNLIPNEYKNINAFIGIEFNYARFLFLKCLKKSSNKNELEEIIKKLEECKKHLKISETLLLESTKLNKEKYIVFEKIKSMIEFNKGLCYFYLYEDEFHKDLALKSFKEIIKKGENNNLDYFESLYNAGLLLYKENKFEEATNYLIKFYSKEKKEKKGKVISILLGIFYKELENNTFDKIQEHIKNILGIEFDCISFLKEKNTNNPLEKKLLIDDIIVKINTNPEFYKKFKIYQELYNEKIGLNINLCENIYGILTKYIVDENISKINFKKTIDTLIDGIAKSDYKDDFVKIINDAYDFKLNEDCISLINSILNHETNNILDIIKSLELESLDDKVVKCLKTIKNLKEDYLNKNNLNNINVINNIPNVIKYYKLDENKRTIFKDIIELLQKIGIKDFEKINQLIFNNGKKEAQQIINDILAKIDNYKNKFELINYLLKYFKDNKNIIEIINLTQKDIKNEIENYSENLRKKIKEKNKIKEKVDKIKKDEIEVKIKKNKEDIILEILNIEDENTKNILKEQFSYLVKDILSKKEKNKRKSYESLYNETINNDKYKLLKLYFDYVYFLGKESRENYYNNIKPKIDNKGLESSLNGKIINKNIDIEIDDLLSKDKIEIIENNLPNIAEKIKSMIEYRKNLKDYNNSIDLLEKHLKHFKESEEQNKDILEKLNNLPKNILEDETIDFEKFNFTKKDIENLDGSICNEKVKNMNKELEEYEVKIKDEEKKFTLINILKEISQNAVDNIEKIKEKIKSKNINFVIAILSKLEEKEKIQKEFLKYLTNYYNYIEEEFDAIKEKNKIAKKIIEEYFKEQHDAQQQIQPQQTPTEHKSITDKPKDFKIDEQNFECIKKQEISTRTRNTTINTNTSNEKTNLSAEKIVKIKKDEDQNINLNSRY